MESSDNRPLPPPRKIVASKSTKKKPPVPLPRKHVNVNNSVFKDGPSSTYSAFKDINNLLKKNIKPEIKMSSENVQERKKSVIQNTRSMSICIEKSFRSLLPRPTRRHTISQTSEDNKPPDIYGSPVDNDIFSSLSFDSPIPSDSNSDRSFSNYYSESDFCSNSQPPNFPPPPLPHDVIYDKIPSSSNSSSQCGSYSTENIYEFISVGQTKSQVNSSYENWNPTSESCFNSFDNVNNEAKHEKSENYENVYPTCLSNKEDTFNGTKSVVLQFDPLHNSFDNLINQKKEKEEECLLLQEIDEILYSSHYSTIESRSVVDYDLENLGEKWYSIPEPPDRVDSIQESSNPGMLPVDNTNDTDFKKEIQNYSSVEEKPRKSSLTSWLGMKINVKKKSDSSSGSIRKMKLKAEEKVEKDNIVSAENSSIFHSGILFISVDEKNKDFEKKCCQIASGQLKYSTNKNQTGNSISLTSLLSIQTVNEPTQR